MIWAYLFFLTLWKTLSCVTPGDTALEVVKTWKAVATSLFCSRADLVYFKWIQYQ